MKHCDIGLLSTCYILCGIIYDLYNTGYIEVSDVLIGVIFLFKMSKMGLCVGTIPPPSEVDISFVGIDCTVVSAPSEVATDGDRGDGSVIGVMGGVVSLCNIFVMSNITLLVNYNVCGKRKFCLCSRR